MKPRNLLCLLVALCFLLSPTIPAEAAPAGQTLRYAFVEQVLDPYTIEVSIGKRLYTARLLGVAPLNGLKPDTLMKLSNLKADSYVKNRIYNTFVYLETDQQERDYEDRLLVYVWLEKPEKRDDAEVRAKMLNAALLLEGYAQWSLTLPNYKYNSFLRACGEEAQKRQAGIWDRKK
ncbi:MAG: thermonuclease family protein [Negativicutes bacterium]|nr:thermonuclease family protein [Negativicutes bacterium]